MSHLKESARLNRQRSEKKMLDVEASVMNDDCMIKLRSSKNKTTQLKKMRSGVKEEA